MQLKRSPLDAAHRVLDAKMVPFGGWEMPLSYPDGTLDEHRRCRSGAVAFDVSHLGTVRVSGNEAFDLLQYALTNDLRRIEPGRAQYTHLLDDDGYVLDDIIVWWTDDGSFDVMPNASNTDRVIDSLSGGSTEAADVTADRAVIAIQGPTARDALASVSAEAAAIGRFRVGTFDFGGSQCRVAGTGYTGEDGVECAVPTDVAADFWQAVLEAGIAPAGLGARDTLRLEAGLPLHGHELGPGITPLQAGLGWVIGWDKEDFRGRAALEAEREAGVSRVLRGVVVGGRRPPRADQTLYLGDRQVGIVSSGNFSPMLERGIGLAFVEPDIDIGDNLEIDMRGERQPAEVVKPPFV